MAKGDKKPVVMQGDRGAANGIAALDAGANIPYEQLGNVVKPNLLYNWYFSNPVNQRGKSEYTSAGTTIDRWRIVTNNTSVAVGDTGITFKGTGSAISALRQVLEYPSDLHGKTVTISILLSDGTFASDKGTVPAAIPAKDTAVVTAKLDDTGANGRYIALFFSKGGELWAQMKLPSGGAEMTVAAVKLELGDTQTLAHQDADGNWVLNEIPDYSEELLKCQRYYQLFTTAAARPSDKRDFRPELRTNATSSNTGTIEIDGVTYYYANADL